MNLCLLLFLSCVYSGLAYISNIMTTFSSSLSQRCCGLKCHQMRERLERERVNINSIHKSGEFPLVVKDTFTRTSHNLYIVVVDASITHTHEYHVMNVYGLYATFHNHLNFDINCVYSIFDHECIVTCNCFWQIR